MAAKEAPGTKGVADKLPKKPGTHRPTPPSSALAIADAVVSPPSASMPTRARL
jgi:hypothetical protein